MKHPILKNELSLNKKFSIIELDNYDSIPDPNLRCGVVYDDYLYVLVGSIPHAEDNAIPQAYRIHLSDWYVQPIVLSMDGLSSQAYITAGIIESLDLPFSYAGHLYNDSICTIVKTSSVENAYSFAKVELSVESNGRTKLLKLNIDPTRELSNVAANDNKLYFFSKSSFVASVKYDKMHIYNIDTGILTTQDITTNLTGKHTIVYYKDSLMIFGGLEFDQATSSVVAVTNKAFRVDLFSPSAAVEVSLLQNSTAIPNTLEFAPYTTQSNRIYLSSSTATDSSFYMLNLDTFTVARRKYDDEGIIGYLSFFKDNRIYLFNTNTLDMWSNESLSEIYLIAAHNIQFMIMDPIQKNNQKYFKYDRNNISKNIFVNTTTTINQTNVYKEV